jgi:hypothetical protein
MQENPMDIKHDGFWWNRVHKAPFLQGTYCLRQSSIVQPFSSMDRNAFGEYPVEPGGSAKHL